MPVAVRTLSLGTPLAAALIGLVAVINPPLAMVLALVIVFGILMLADVRIGICIFAFSSTLLDGVGAGSVSADKLVGIALVISWLAALAIRQDVRDEITEHAPAFAVLLLLMAAWYTASVTWAEDSGEARYQLVRLMPNLLIVPIAVSAIGSARTLRFAVLALLAGGLLSAFYGYLTDPRAAGAEGRLAGSGLDANSLAVWLLMAATLAWGALMGIRDTAGRILVWCGIAFCGLAILATGSRAALIAIGVSLFFGPMLVRRGHRLLAVSFALLVVFCSVGYITTVADDAVREHITESEDGGSGRTTLWTVGMRMVKANPVLGVGGGNFRVATIHYLLTEPGEVNRSSQIIDEPLGAHNTYLQVTAETGFVGGAIFLAMLLLGVWMSIRAVMAFTRAGMLEEEMLARGVVLAYFGVMVGMFFIQVDNSKPLWLMLSLGPVIYKLARVRGAIVK